MVDLVNTPEDTEARRLEARRRRAEREGLSLAERNDPPANYSVPATSAAYAAPAQPAGEPAADEEGRSRREGGGNLVEFRNREGKEGKEGKKDKKRNRDPAPTVDPAEEPATARPVPDIANSRLMARLNDMKAAKRTDEEEEAKPGRNAVLWSFILAVLVPTIGITAYLYFWATDQYSTEVRFAVRNAAAPAASASSSAMAMMGSAVGASAPDLSDSYVVVEYLQSREFVEEIHNKIDLRTIYAVSHADYWYRMRNDISIEKMVVYMNTMVAVTFDMYTGIISVRSRAFSSEDAKKMGDNVLGMTEAIVNRISERARRDTVRESETEVTRAEARLRLARAAIAKFRGEEQAVDPNMVAQGQQSIVNQLESQLTALKAELNQLTQTMSASAPRVRVQQSRVDALEKQIDDEKTKVALKNRAGSALSGQLSRYEELVTERDFAQAAYVSALNALERSRMEAERNQRYLALIVTPRPAQDSEYPERGRYSFLSFLALFGIWAVATLVLGSIRDHMQ